MPHSSSNPFPANLPRRFESTRWSIVADACHGTPASSRAALEELCRAYWYPIYSFLRRKGLPPETAMDVTQSFFVRVLEQDFFDAATPERGRLRSFLLKAAQNHLASCRRADAARKRSPQGELLSLDQLQSEARFQLEPSDTRTAESRFERQWALTLIERAMDRLRGELTDKLGSKHAARLVQLLTGQAEGISLAAVAEELHTTEAAMKVRMHRIRGRYRQILRLEVADTVADTVDVDEELRNLLAAL